MQDMIHLIEPVIPALRRYARALLRDAAAADDLVQDCLERAISRWSQRRDGDAKSWLFAILHNLAINRLRQTARRGPHVALDAVAEDVLTTPPRQEDSLRNRDVLSALAALPEAQRSVLLLVGVENLSYADAARVLDIPLGTVMSRLARGRNQLRRLLEGEAVPHLRSVK
jgi:RNA polymerase sigma factor (sigma-70 family)